MQSRDELLKRLGQEQFDILVIGGGATGSGIALDAATRGLKVALVERDDFGAGTSSRSTKLIHGGVRYLEKAILHFDGQEFHLVKEALHERKVLLKIAPYLAHPLPLLTPLYSWLETPYYYTGLKLYDWISGEASLGHSSFLSKDEALEHCPLLKQEGLHGGVLYYDGQFNDARMNCAIALTAAEKGALTVNHIEVQGLIKQGSRISGVEAVDTLSRTCYRISARVVINATGPFADGIRHLDDPSLPNLIAGSSGIHLILNKKFCPSLTGVLIPKTEDNRVIFMLPWEGKALVGTTDNPCNISETPRPQAEEVAYLLRHVQHYFGIEIPHHEVLAAWSGIRPLARDLTVADTSQLCRDYHIETQPSGLISIVGGKWTTYRKMAEAVLDRAIEEGSLHPTSPCTTADILLRGTEGYKEEIIWSLVSDKAIDPTTATHLAHTYGTRALDLLANVKMPLKRLAPDFPYIEAEVAYSVKEEYACSAIDILARRTRLAFLDVEAAYHVLPRVIDIMAPLLKWDAARCQEELDKALAFLETMRLPTIS